MSTQQNIRLEITRQIVDALESGNLPPWRKPWSSDPNAGVAANVISGNRYTGVNPLILELASRRHGFKSRWWGTIRQWNDWGASVMRRPNDVEPGKWGTRIIYCSQAKKTKVDDFGDEIEDRFFFTKTYTVFNIDQVEGSQIDHLRAGNSESLVARPIIDTQRYRLAEQAVEPIPAAIIHGGNQAYYQRNTDAIHMPLQKQFESLDAYYETLGHELTHWSELRLAWNHEKQGYAAGEMRAEIAASYWCSELGLGMGDFDQSCTYLQGWLAAMKQDSNFIFKVSSHASKAVDYLLSFSRSDELTLELDPSAKLELDDNF